MILRQISIVGKQMVPGKSIDFNQVTRLIALEDFTDFIRRESFRSYDRSAFYYCISLNIKRDNQKKYFPLIKLYTYISSAVCKQKGIKFNTLNIILWIFASHWK
jgi:hypothetical protein